MTIKVSSAASRNTGILKSMFISILRKFVGIPM